MLTLLALSPGLNPVPSRWHSARATALYLVGKSHGNHPYLTYNTLRALAVWHQYSNVPPPPLTPSFAHIFVARRCPYLTVI